MNKSNKTGENYGETIIVMSENVSAHGAQLNFQTANIIKPALKLEASVINAATYFFLSSIKGNA